MALDQLFATSPAMYVPICAERATIRELILKHGGKITDKPPNNTVLAIIPENADVSRLRTVENAVSVRYLHKCIARGEIVSSRPYSIGASSARAARPAPVIVHKPTTASCSSSSRAAPPTAAHAPEQQQPPHRSMREESALTSISAASSSSTAVQAAQASSASSSVPRARADRVVREAAPAASSSSFISTPPAPRPDHAAPHYAVPEAIPPDPDRAAIPEAASGVSLTGGRDPSPEEALSPRGSSHKTLYTSEDDQRMLKFARDHVYLPVQGQKMWKMAEAAGITKHSWQSMQNRYRRHLMRCRTVAPPGPSALPGGLAVAEPPLALTNGSPPRASRGVEEGHPMDGGFPASSSGVPPQHRLSDDGSSSHQQDDETSGQRVRSRSAHGGGASSSSDMAAQPGQAGNGGRPPTYRHRFKSTPGLRRSRPSSPNGSRLTPKRSTQMPPDMSTPVQKNEEHSFFQPLSTGEKTARISSPVPRDHDRDLSARHMDGAASRHIMKLLSKPANVDLSSPPSQREARAVDPMARVRDCAKLARCRCRGAFDIRHTMPQWLVLDQYRSIGPCDVEMADVDDDKGAGT